VLTASPRNLGQQPSHGQQHYEAGHDSGPPIEAYPSEAFTRCWCAISDFAIVIGRGHRNLLAVEAFR
jgi:hypothetical protein